MAEPLQSSDGAPVVEKTVEEVPKVAEEPGNPSLGVESKVDGTQREFSSLLKKRFLDWC